MTSMEYVLNDCEAKPPQKQHKSTKTKTDTESNCERKIGRKIIINDIELT